jgi:hypothetical protein
MLACSKKPQETPSAGTIEGPTPDAAPAPSPAPAAEEIAVPPKSEVLTGLDTCLIGTWSAQWVKMSVGSLNAEGGANARLAISESGASVIDFTKMSKVSGTTPGSAFEFHYAGPATAILKTPKRGSFEAANANYSGLRVTVSANVPGAKPTTVLKNKPLSQLATAASAFALANVAPAASAAPAPSAAPLPSEAALGPNAIDRSPVFSSATYTCADSALMLYSKDQSVTWRFVKSDFGGDVRRARP